MKLSKSYFFIVFLYVSVFTANAQKLPNIQEISVRAPADIKIDGRLNEWGDKLQAKNNADRIFYTISNDDKNLYLTIKTMGSYGNEKIVKGGVTFTISHSIEKKKREKDPNNVSVTFPLLEEKEAASINARNFTYFSIDDKERPARRRDIDSIYNSINLLVDQNFKEIKVIGIKNIDTFISVYNAVGIKAAARVDQTMHLVYELAIPLKYLGLGSNMDDLKFSYNVKLNAIQQIGRSSLPTLEEWASRVAPGAIFTRINEPASSRPPDPDVVYRFLPSDFWGEYTLAK